MNFLHFFIFLGGIILISSMYYVHQNPIERAPLISPKALKFIFTYSLPTVISIIFLIGAEEYYNTIIISLITGGISVYMYNLFEIKENGDEKLKEFKTELKKTNENYKEILRNLAYAFKANEEFSEILQCESYNVAKCYYDKRKELEDRIDGSFPDPDDPDSKTVDVGQETAKLLLSTASKKSMSALDQFRSGKIFLRRKLYEEFWEKAVQNSNSYLSICDLSMYSGKQYTGKEGSEEGSEIIKQESYDWKKRVEEEIDVLKETRIRKFDKIILFESSGNCQDGNNNPIFNVVAELWEGRIQELENSGIKSHCQSNSRNRMIWKFSREDFSSCLNNINKYYKISGRINSNDLGIFGDHLIGEEFKVNEVLTTTGKLGQDDDWDELKFLYRLILNEKLVTEIKKMAIKKMECQ